MYRSRIRGAHSDRWRTHFAIFVLCLAWTVSAYAQGFSVYEDSACATGRAGAGVAEPCADGSAIFFNPAGLGSIRGKVVSLSAAPIAPRGNFTDDISGQVSALRPRWFVVPSGYGAVSLGSRWVVGVGLFVPYGLTSDWPSTSEGRFVGYMSRLTGIYVEPTVAWRLTDRFIVGAGLDVTHVSVELRRRLDLSTVPVAGAPSGVTFGTLGVPRHTDFADVDLTGSGYHFGGHFGVLFRPSERISFGARYLLRERVGVNGTVASSQVATGTPFDQLLRPLFGTAQALGPQDATTSIPLPDQIVAGVSVHPTADLKVFADYQFTGWHVLDQVVIQNQFAAPTVLIENFHDAHGILIGAEQSFRSLILRAGTALRTPAAPDETVTPLLPDAFRVLASAGVGVKLTDHLRSDIAFAHVWISDRRGRTTDLGAIPPSVALNNGVYQYNVNLVDVGLVFSF